MKKILVVDDEPSIVTLLKYNIEAQGNEVESATDGLDAYEMVQQNEYDLIILDVMLPRMDGMDVCRRLRKEGNDTPIMMLTAKGDEYDRIIGLELGADDYMTKPFNVREVIARLNAIMRRTESRDLLDEKKSHKKRQEAVQIELKELERSVKEKDSLSFMAESIENEANQTIHLGDIQIYTERYEVFVRGKKIDITPKEFELLIYMALRKGRILSREQLLQSVWDYGYAGETRIVDVHISHLREKIEYNSKKPEYIKTVRGFGYKFEVPEE